MQTRLLVAASSYHRRLRYILEMAAYGFEVRCVSNAMECLEHLRQGCTDALLVESDLLWGGAEGVLAVRAEDSQLSAIPVVLVASERVSPEIYSLARFSIQGFFVREPDPRQLSALIDRTINEVNEDSQVGIA